MTVSCPPSVTFGVTARMTMAFYVLRMRPTSALPDTTRTILDSSADTDARPPSSFLRPDSDGEKAVRLKATNSPAL